MLKELGEFFGGLTIFFYALAVLSFIVKFINKKFKSTISKNEVFYKKYYLNFMKFIIKNHMIFGILAVVSLIIHFLIQFSQFGINTVGIIAAIIMLLQIVLGIILKKSKSGKKQALLIHRSIAAALIISIIIHIA